MYRNTHNSPETGQHYDPWRELSRDELGPPAPVPGPDYAEQRELGLEIQNDKNFDTRNFYMALGAVTKAVIEGQPEHLIERVPAKTAFQRRYENRVEKRLDKLVRARLKHKNAHKVVQDKNGEDKIYKTQEYGLGPAISQQKRLKEVRQRYKKGEISKQQMEIEKLDVRASRGIESGVQSFGQRRQQREGIVQSARARMIGLPRAGRRARNNLLAKERKLAEMQGVDPSQRQGNHDTTETNHEKYVRLKKAGDAVKNGVKKSAKHAATAGRLIKEDVVDLSKFTGRNAKRVAKGALQGTNNFYNRKKTEASTGYQDGLAGNLNEGKVFPTVDEKLVKPLAHKAGEVIGRRRSVD